MASIHQKTDSELLFDYVNGKETALAVLVSRHQSRIYGFIYSKIPDREVCDDIFQETFLKVIRNIKLKGYNEEGKFLSWVMRIAHNLTIDHFRFNKKMPMLRETENYDPLGYLKDCSLTIENELIELQISDDIRKIVEKLPKDQKEVIKMRYYDDLSFKEIAEQSGVSINTALGRMRYAIINIRKIVTQNNIILTN